MNNFRLAEKISSIVLIACVLLCGKALAQDDASKPNFVFILADDCSYRDLELYGGPARTPHLNKLAREGMKFNRCYQAAPMCSPTRHALYTGIYPVKNGAHPNHARAYPKVKSIAHYLGDEGYQVVLSGKRHISPKSVFPFTYLKEFADPTGKDVPVVDGWRYPKVFNVLKKSADQSTPFCLFLCSNEPHAPYTKGDPKPYKDAKLSPQQFEFQREEYARYLAEITYFDGQVGEIMSMLEKLDLRKKTIVMVSTEQGSGFPFGKWTCYEIGVASGLVASWPGVIKPGSQSDAIVEYTDVVPTMLDAAGTDIPKAIEGRSFLPMLKGETKTHSQYAFSIQTTRGVNGYEAPFGIRTVVGSRYRYIRNLFPENEFSIPASRKIRKLAKDYDEAVRQRAERYLKRPPEELYDVIADPYCRNNLIADSKLADEHQKLSTELDRWMKQQGDDGRQIELDAHQRQSDSYRAKLSSAALWGK